MSTAVRLPSELREFLALPGPQSLLVRGPPGSGKSTLCLALLEASPGERLLVTSRVSTDELNREFPWLGENGSRSIKFVDTSDLDSTAGDPVKAAAEQMLFAGADAGERRGLKEFLMLPSPIQDAWSQLPESSASTVVIDSWDALIENHLGALAARTSTSIDRAEVERMLLRRMGRSRAHLVIVLERENLSQLDYLVNGVVVTHRESTNDRLERWLLLPKLRGIRIANASYPYTVEGAKFQCIEPMNSYRELRRGHFDPEPDPLPGFLWPGSISFASNFGRLPLGKLTLLETDNAVPDQIRHNFIAPAMAHTMHRGGRVLLVPPPTLSSEEVWHSIEGSIANKRIPEQFRVVDVSGQLERATQQSHKEFLDAVVSYRAMVPASAGQDAQNSELSAWMRGGVKGGPPNLGVVYATGLEALANALKIPITAEVAAAMPASINTSLGDSEGLHLIAIGRVDGPLFTPLLSLAAMHLRMHSRQGRIFVYGTKPWTPGLVITEAADGGPYELLKIV
jgi:KaiC/GvpD/RAD55 family RecA-like ATPase